MKHFYTILLFLLLMPSLVVAQNLVPNPSFEDTVGCPNADFTNMENLEHWYNSGGSADLFHQCANSTFSNSGNPLNKCGFQNSYHGIAHAGLYIYCDFLPGDREFMGVKLIQQLNVGTTYCVSAYISRSDSINYPIYPLDCAINNFGFRFSTFKYDPYLGVYPPIDNFSHVKNDDIIYDSINWVKISGTYIADSAYEYLTIGNFYENSQTNSSTTCTGRAYYYIDFVSVSTDTIGCQTITKSPSPLQSKIQLYPNPTSNSISLKNLTGSHSYSILTTTGYTIKTGSITEAENAIDVSALPNGLYFLRLDGRESFKFVVQK